jgi:hypothetical protein
MYATVGTRLARRRIVGDSKLPYDAFIIWWYALAATSLPTSLVLMLAALGVTHLNFSIAVAVLSLLLICIALWGLLYYLVFLFTGKRGTWLPLAVGYAVYFAFLMVAVAQAGPSGVIVERWSVTIDYERDLSESWVGALAVALLVFPQILSAIAYFSLVFRLQDRSQRYRVSLVSWSILLWFGSAYMASISGLAEQDWWQVLSRLIGLAAAAVVLYAYEPPRWLQRTLKVHPLPG